MTRRANEMVAGGLEAKASVARALPDSPNAWMEDLCNNHVLPDVADLGGQVAAVTGCAPIDVFLDLDFVKFMLELDPQLLTFGDEHRGLYRLAMAGTLPESIRGRQDKSSFEPAVAAAAVAANTADELRELGSLHALSDHGLVDPVPFRALFSEWLAAVAQGERSHRLPEDAQFELVWHILCAEAFLRENGRGRALR
jgi:hypothetical protein